MARRRAARGVKTVGLKPFVVDDVSAAVPSDAPPPPSTGATLVLDAREALDARRRAWELERLRFERSRRATGPNLPAESAPDDIADS